VESLRARAEALAGRARTAGFEAEAVASTAVAGGGAGAESTLPSAAVALRRTGLTADALAAALRALALPVVARIEDGRVLLDLRSIAEEEDEELGVSLEMLRA
jgi:L-seryl-tRNA(Ser) seleniumtransferase